MAMVKQMLKSQSFKQCRLCCFVFLSSANIFVVPFLGKCLDILERILVAHELGHAVLHTKIAMMHGFQEMEVFDDRSIEENEANFFAAELLLEDGKVLECLSEHTFFETAKMLYVPAALLDYKFSLLHEKGELVNSMYIRKADFLKEDLHAYDNDIGYGDI